MCANHKWTGIVIARKHTDCTLGKMITTAKQFLKGLGPMYGYVVTVHDPSIATTNELTIFGDDDFDEGKISALFGSATEETRKSEKKDSAYCKTVQMNTSCFKTDTEVDTGVHLHVLVWQKNKRQETYLMNTYRYKQL